MRGVPEDSIPFRDADGKPCATYQTWCSMKTRCTNRNHEAFHNYGGRGITFDPRWSKYKAFVDDMGLRPEGLTLDRIDNNKGYNKDNCRWATTEEQCSNTRHNHYISFEGITRTLTQWVKHLGMSETTFRNRLKRGWTIEKAMTTPIKGR